LVLILHFMGGSGAEVPTSPDEQPVVPAGPEVPGRVPGLRASDADREQVVDRLRDEFVAGRLSQETFMQRMHTVFESKQVADLPPLLADLPAEPAPRRTVGGWLRAGWAGVAMSVERARQNSQARGSRPGRAAMFPVPIRSMTTGMHSLNGRQPPVALHFPRGGGGQFSIGRDANCDLAISDMTVSRHHAQLERTEAGWLLSDLASTNGTRVNGWRVRGKVPVRAGDLVSFGNLETVFLRGSDPATS
jgi:hypothetical protein